MDFELFFMFIFSFLSLFIIASVFISLHLIKKKYERVFNDNQTVVRSLLIDKENKIVKFFNRNDIKNVKTIHLDQFLTQFSTVDTDKFNNWMTYLLKKDDAKGEFLEIEVFLNTSRKKYVSILECTGVVNEKKLIYIDSYLLPHINKNKIYKEEPVNFNNVYKKFNIYPTSKGFTINFKIAYLNLFGNMDEFNKLIYATLENIISEVSSLNNRYIIEYSKEDLMIFDYRSYDEKAVNHYITKILKRFNRYLEVNSLKDTIRLSAGFISNAHYQKNILKLSAEAIKLSETALNNEYNILPYRKNAVVSDTFLDVNEIATTDIATTYQPIYSVKSKSIIGYFGMFDRSNPMLKKLFASFANLYKQEDVIYVVRSFFKKMIDNYAELDQKREYSLFLDGRVNLLDSVMSQLNKTKSIKKINVVICVDEKDAYSFGNNFDGLQSYIVNIISKNVKVCMILRDKDLILDNRTYELFDYFIVDANIDRKNLSDASNLSYRVIVEKLLKFKKPIILTNVNGFDEVELLVRSGITYIASAAIAPTEKTLSQPSAKVIAKIDNMFR